MGTPRSSSSIPWRMVTKPMPPASTTPAFFSTGFCSTVSARASRARSMADSRTYSKPVFSSAARPARSPARRETVRTVPSAGFITAR